MTKRYYIDPHEEPVQKGDHVILSDYKIPWEITKIARDGSVLYLRSVVGGRFGTESPVRIKAAYRDENNKPDIDWTQAYEEEL